MGQFEEFAKTLERKIRREIEAERPAPAPGQSTPPFAEVQEELPLGFAWILGQGTFADSHNPDLSRGHKAYGVRPRSRPAHRLNASQTVAKELFERWGVRLSPAFDPVELKRAWRQVAFATHPDHGGTNLAFREARTAFQILTTLFRGKTPN